MYKHEFQQLDLDQLATVTGAGYGKACAAGAAAGAITGIPGGPKGIAFGAAFGCVAGMFKRLLGF